MVGEPLDQGAAVEEFRRQNGRDNGVPCVLGEVEILQRMRAAGLWWMGQAGQVECYHTREMLQTECSCANRDPSEWCAILCEECGGRIRSSDTMMGFRLITTKEWNTQWCSSGSLIIQ